jgi:hypothetical protein
MSDIPNFALYGEGDPAVEEALQPSLALRNWSDLSKKEKTIALQYVFNSGWIDKYSPGCLAAVSYLNHTYLRQCPGKRLHTTPSDGGIEQFAAKEAAFEDFKDIFLNEQSEAMVLRMLSVFARCHIDQSDLGYAKKATQEAERNKNIADAFAKFDRLANCLNHIFRQFAVNQVVTRSGFVPRQDDRITDGIYVPTLKALADPKWAAVSVDLGGMFRDYREQHYPEVITKAHSAIQRFLQIAVGEEGKSGKGELAKLFKEAKDRGIISTNRFVDPVVAAISGFIPSERATNSTAKPALKDATPADALLMMNVVMVLLQHCLQNMK